jgi:chemotaxis protein MotB
MKQIFLISAVAIMAFASCVSSKKYKSLNDQVTVLNSQVASKDQQIAEKDKLIGQLKEENIQASKEAAACRLAEQELKQKVANLNAALAEQGTSLEQIRKNAEEALAKFDDAGADVYYKNGLVYISLQDKLLFPSGSVTLNKDGVDALKIVADVVQDYPKVKIYVVGNTDTDGVGKGYKDNWSLSTERANTVVRIFRDKYGIDPGRLTAAGRSKYNPVIENTTAENKARNRRTEIILNPDLSRLWDLMEKSNK